MYHDPVRFIYTGDREKGPAYNRLARRALLLLARQISDSGVGSARRRVKLDNGVTIDVQLAGLEATATIHVPGEIDLTHRVVALVSHFDAAKLSVIDVDAGRVVRSVTGLGPLAGLVARGRYAYALNVSGVLIKYDIGANTAVGTSTGLGGLANNLLLSDNGKHLFVRYAATGIPGGGGTYAGVYTYQTEDLARISVLPNTLFGQSNYGGATKPGTDTLYLTTLGDGNGDTELGWDGDEDQQALEGFDWRTGTFIGGEAYTPPFLATSVGFSEIAISEDGARLYTASNAGTRFINGVLTDVHSLLAYDIAEGVPVRVGAFGLADQLTGSVAIARDGRRVYVVGKDGGVRVLDVDDMEMVPGFMMREDTITDTESGRSNTICIGPRRDRAPPDNRVYFLSIAGKSLWVFRPGADTPSKKFTFVDSVSRLAVTYLGAREQRKTT